MTTYTATYRNDIRFAEHDLDAATAEEALTKARTLLDADPLALDWQRYECNGHFDEIEINGPENGDTALWQSDAMRLRAGARDLFEALEFIAADIEEGVKDTDAWLRIARTALAKARPRAA